MTLPNDVIYFNRTIYNNTNDLMDATVDENFSRILIHNPSQYHVVVERFECNMNAIPLINAGAGHVRIVVGVDVFDPILPDCFSIEEVTAQLEILVPRVGAANPFGNLHFRLDHEGYVYIEWDLGNVHNIQLGTDIQELFGFQATLVNAIAHKSTYPRFDCGNQINHIYLRTTMPVVSDAVGQLFENILTDVSVTGSKGTSRQLDGNSNIIGLGGSYTPRQKVVYNPAQRRFTNMHTTAPIQNIRIEAWYTNMRGRTARVQLGKGMGFSVKIGFYARK